MCRGSCSRASRNPHPSLLTKTPIMSEATHSGSGLLFLKDQEVEGARGCTFPQGPRNGGGRGMGMGNCREFRELPGADGAHVGTTAQATSSPPCHKLGTLSQSLGHSANAPHRLWSASTVLGTGQRRGVSPALPELLGPSRHIPAGLVGAYLGRCSEEHVLQGGPPHHLHQESV